MDRFGDFQLLDKLYERDGEIVYRASHARQPQPLRLTLFRGLPAQQNQRIRRKCDRLLGLKHPHIELHLGHGMVGDTPYRVSPYIESVSMTAFLKSLKSRRVILPMDNVFSISRALCKALHALHGHEKEGKKAQLTHGAICADNVHVAPTGNVCLMGIGSWHEKDNEDHMEQVWDGAGLAALIYDMLRATKTSGELPKPSTEMDSLLRVALGIGDADEMLNPKNFGNRLREIAVRQHVYTTLDRFKALAQRTCEAISHEQEIVNEKPDVDAPSTIEESEAPVDEPVAIVGEEPVLPKKQSETEAGIEQESLDFDEKTPPRHRIDEEQELAGAQTQGTETQAHDSAAELDASEAVTQKSRLSFFQWVKNKNVFPDNVLQLCMDAYDSEAEMLQALWENDKIDDKALRRELTHWLETDVMYELSSEEKNAMARLLSLLPASIVVGRQFLPLSMDAGDLVCLCANPFQSDVIETLKTRTGANSVSFRVETPKVVAERCLEGLYQAGRGAVISPFAGVHVKILVFDATKGFPTSLGVRIALKGWLVEWMASAQELINSAITSSPAAVIGVTEKDSFEATEVLVELKTQPGGNQIPCFVIGNDDDDEAIERILDLGVEDYFSTPVNADTVVAKLRRIFNRTMNYDSTPPSLSGGPVPPPIPSEGMMEDMVLASVLGDVGNTMGRGGFIGPVSSLNLFDFVEHMVLRQQTFALEFIGEASGHLGMLNGEIVFAEVLETKGVDAFSKMIQHEEGVFKVEFGVPPPDTNVSLSTSELLLTCKTNPEN